MVTLADIQTALGRIRESIYISPCARSEAFSKQTGNSVFLKLENLQKTGAFKERGALNKLLTLNAEQRRRGVIAASAGNHAQGLAYHAGRQKIRAQICMPLTTPLIKVTATRNYGADVVLHGANYDEAYDEALTRSQQQHLTFVHAFDDDAVIAGQGTLGLEILEQHPEIEVMVVPIGGGGLIGGIACAVKESKPHVQIFGVQPSRIPSMKVAVAEGGPVTLKPALTIADGIGVRRAGDRTLPLVQKYVDDIVTVEEEEIANAILLLLEREKTLAEGAGAAAIAALLNQKLPLTAKKIAVLVCGGNIDVTLLARIIERGLVKDGRLVRLRVHLPDYPGALHKLTGILAQHRANIVETSYDRAYYGVDLGDTAIDITMETRGSGIYLHLHTPLLTWFLLGVAGLSIVFFYSQISYLFYVFMKFVRHYQWRPDRHKVALSSLANLIVWGFVLLVLTSTDLHFTPRKIFEFTPKLIILLAAVVLVGGVVWALFRSRISLLSHKLLQSPLRPGLFPNYERTRFLRDRIPEQGLRASPIRVVMTASNLDTGDERFFVNKPTTELERDPGVDVAFIREKLEHPDDLIKCVVASSAFPMAYEPVEMQGRLWSDGALVAKQPIFPAIRLGADVLFLVMVEPASEIAPRIKTFLDVGIRAFDILMSRNLQADLRILDNVNQICEAYAAKLGTRPEHLRLEIGTRTMRFLKAFTVRPASPLAATLLDFDGAIARPAMEQGYNDGARVVREFIDYVAQLPATSSKYVLRLVAEQVRGSGMGD